ncbi:MAG: hypothetical protein H6R11_1773, partial [Proteobacteria bacterium]|nr:hypothetical protein [Pseudomonadota bacterium]
MRAICVYPPQFPAAFLPALLLALFLLPPELLKQDRFFIRHLSLPQQVRPPHPGSP